MFRKNHTELWLVSLMLVMVLVLSACNDQSDSTPAAATAGEPQTNQTNQTPVVLGAATETTGGTEAADSDAEEAVIAEAEDAITETVGSEGVVNGESVATGDVTVITDTQLITGTKVTTDVTVTTDTVVLEQQLITTVITATDVVTDVKSDTESASTSESEIITDTAELAPETGTGAAAVDVQVTPIPPTATPTVVVELTRVVTATQVVTETVEVTAVATPSADSTPVPEAVTGATNAAAGWSGVEGAAEDLVRASVLVGYNFENSDGAVSGEIKDLLIDASTGRILFATLEYGGFLDIGDTELPVPLSAFGIGPDGELVLNIDQERLQEFPDLGDDWPDTSNPNWDDEINTFWSDSGITTDQDFTEASTSIRRVSELMNYPVADAGTGASSIQDMLISLQEGRVKYLLLASAAGAGAATEWIVVPFSAFDASNLGTEFTYMSNIDPSVVEQAPRLSESDFNEFGVIDASRDDDWDTYWNDAGFPATINNGN